jgi:hypothetical protein
VSDLTAKCELPWWIPQDSGWTKVQWHIMVWCGSAHAHVDLSRMFWQGPSYWPYPHIILGYRDEELSLPDIHNSPELADWAKLLTWLNEQPWPEWSLPDVTNSDTVKS